MSGAVRSRRTALVLLLLALLAGCGGDPEDHSSSNAPALESGWLNHRTKLVTVKVDGTEMLCLERAGDTSAQTTSGAYSGLSCDWYGWHLKRERP